MSRDGVTTGLQTRRVLSSDWDSVSSDRPPEAVTRREEIPIVCRRLPSGEKTRIE